MGRLEADPGWRFVAIGCEGQRTDVGGVNPWEVEWTATGGRITVAHPQYPAQRHIMSIYEVTGSVPPIRFAAGEFSVNGNRILISCRKTKTDQPPGLGYRGRGR